MEIGIYRLNGKDSLAPLITETLSSGRHHISIIDDRNLSDHPDQRAFDGVIVEGSCRSSDIRMDGMSESAQDSGYVNVIVNDEGKLKGYSTAAYGLERMLKDNGMELDGRRTAVITGSELCETVIRTLRSLGAEVTAVSPDHEELAGRGFSVLINPGSDIAFPEEIGELETVIDLRYPPLRTPLVYEAQIRGLQAFGGLEMRLHEIINAYGLITGEKIGEEQIECCRKAVYRSKRNIVIIGMPTAGKTTISNLLSRCHARTVSEMDDFIIRETGMSISDYFSEFGEKSFRERESEICRKLSEGTGAVISTGGGVVTRHENMLQLAANSLIVWLDRDLPLLEGREDRPLSSDRTSLERLYEERRPLYEKYSDIRIENNMTIEDVMKALEEVFS